MDVKLSHSFITVLDLDEAIAFYRDVIGLEVCTDVRIGSMRWIIVAAAAQPYGVEISLETPQGRPGDIDALTKVIEDWLPDRGDLRDRRLRLDVRASRRVRRSGRAGAGRPALRRPGLCGPGPLREHGPHRPAVAGVSHAPRSLRTGARRVDHPRGEKGRTVDQAPRADRA